MALDATARESNFRDSVKKFLVDNLETAEGVPILFDSRLTTPNISGRTLDKWYRVEFGPITRGVPSEALIRIICCTKEDNEGFKLAQLGDKLLGYLTDTSSNGDGTKRIPFYQSSPTSAWVKIGSLIVFSIDELGESVAPEGTKFKVVLVRLRFVSKI